MMAFYTFCLLASLIWMGTAWPAAPCADGLDQCGVCGGDSRSCCSFHGSSNGTSCACDGIGQPDDPCGVFCQSTFDACGVCGGFGRCCQNGGIKDPITGVCDNVRRMQLMVMEFPGKMDGFPMPVLAVASPKILNNLSSLPTGFRPFPGPLLRVQQNDVVAIEVYNELLERVTDVHWHGIEQSGTAWMDGAYGVTGCGIDPGRNFTYTFTVSQTGTYWYHSHVHAQYTEGLQGPFVAEYPQQDDDPVWQVYPYQLDYVIMLSEWFHETGRDEEAELFGPWNAFEGYQPQFPWPPLSTLMNGRGQFDCDRILNCEEVSPHYSPGSTEGQFCQYFRRPFLFGNCTSFVLNTTAEQYFCPVGSWIRFRIICSAANIPMRFWVDRHPLILVARDGVEIEPVEVNFVTIPVGQRIDAVVRCNQSSTADASFAIFSSANPNFFPVAERAQEKVPFYSELFSYAFLRYVPDLQGPFNFSSLPSTFRPPIIDPVSQTVDFGNTTLFPDNNMLAEYNYISKTSNKAPPATRQITLVTSVGWDTNTGSPIEWWLTNNISFIPPPVPYLQHYLFHLEGIVPRVGSQPSPPSTPTSPNVTLSSYTINAAMDEVLELVFISYSGQQHPWHLHGLGAYFLGAEELTNDTILNFVYNGSFGALKDSVPNKSRGDSWTVPAYGYMVLRVEANNPGPWLLHCHVDWHMATGMALVLDVGYDEGYPGLSAPPLAYTTKSCGIPPSQFQSTLCSSSSDVESYRNAVIGLGVVVALFGSILVILLVRWCNKRRKVGDSFLVA